MAPRFALSCPSPEDLSCPLSSSQEEELQPPASFAANLPEHVAFPSRLLAWSQSYQLPMLCVGLRENNGPLPALESPLPSHLPVLLPSQRFPAIFFSLQPLIWGIGAAACFSWAGWVVSFLHAVLGLPASFPREAVLFFSTMEALEAGKASPPSSHQGLDPAPSWLRFPLHCEQKQRIVFGCRCHAMVLTSTGSFDTGQEFSWNRCLQNARGRSLKSSCTPRSRCGCEGRGLGSTFSWRNNPCNSLLQKMAQTLSLSSNTLATLETDLSPQTKFRLKEFLVKFKPPRGKWRQNPIFPPAASAPALPPLSLLLPPKSSQVQHRRAAKRRGGNFSSCKFSLQVPTQGEKLLQSLLFSFSTPALPENRVLLPCGWIWPPSLAFLLRFVTQRERKSPRPSQLAVARLVTVPVWLFRGKDTQMGSAQASLHHLNVGWGCSCCGGWDRREGAIE